MLRGYYDGSGKSHEKDSKFLTLTGIVASESVWKEFENKWNAVLNRHGAPSLHMADAMSLRGDFSRANGWDDQRVDNLVRDLWNVIGEFRFSTEGKGSNLTAFSCTIIMEDYRRAKAENTRLREAEAICVNCCFKLPFDIERFPEIVMIFDCSEGFQKTITRVWEKAKGKELAGWPRQIRNIVNRTKERETLGTSYECPMQAADMIAWLVNNRRRNPRRVPGWDMACILSSSTTLRPMIMRQ